MRKTRHRTWIVREPVHLLVIAIAVGAAAYGSLLPSQSTTGAASEAGLTVVNFQLDAPVQIALDRPAGSTLQPTGASRLAAASTAEAIDSSDFGVMDEAAIQARLHALAVPAGPSDVTQETAPGATPTPEPEDPNCIKDQSHPLYCIYTVQSGDTLSGIAGKYGLKSSGAISGGEMLAQSNKPDVVDSDDIKPGQKLRVPVTSGIIHTAFSAESLADIAESYGVTIEDIRALAANQAGSSLQAGQEVLVPNPSELPFDTAATPTPTPSPAPAATSTPAPTATPEPEPVVPDATPVAQGQTQVPPPIIQSTATATPIRPAATPTKAPVTATPPTAAARTQAASGGSRPGFIWPVSGPVSSYMGSSHPLGIDIDLFNNEGAPVGAAAAGTVTFAGGNPCCSYGYYVIVDHGAGVTSLYAHFSKINVKEGQKVTQGQIIGYGGSTGYATGTHLHFEVRLNGNVVDPMIYLPK